MGGTVDLDEEVDHSVGECQSCEPEVGSCWKPVQKYEQIDIYLYDILLLSP